MGSNPHTPKFLPDVFAQIWKHLRNAPRFGHHTRCFTLFTRYSSVQCFYELMRVPFAGMRYSGQNSGHQGLLAPQLLGYGVAVEGSPRGSGRGSPGPHRTVECAGPQHSGSPHGRP